MTAVLPNKGISAMQRWGTLLILSVFGTFLATAPACGAAEADVDLKERPWSVDLKARYYLGSHTSYEFGNPFPPFQIPLSRLEFPLDSWWGSLEVRRGFSRFSAGIEAATNLTDEADGRMRDSDWDDDSQPQVLTIYSESSCRIKPSYQVRGDVDLKIADWLGLPSGFDLRPALGFRWQRLSFLTHDGLQIHPAPGDTQPPEPLPGDGIAFEQTYRNFFLGIKMAHEWKKLPQIRRLKLRGQLDWAYVTADNEDRHLLRMGERFTYQKTSGQGWHALVGLDMGLTERLTAMIEMDYLRINTDGTHRLVNRTFGIDFLSKYAVTVWSEQTSLTLGLRYAF